MYKLQSNCKRNGIEDACMFREVEQWVVVAAFAKLLLTHPVPMKLGSKLQNLYMAMTVAEVSSKLSLHAILEIDTWDLELRSGHRMIGA